MEGEETRNQELTVKNCSSEGIFTAIKAFFLEKKLNINMMVGFSADNCSVMMGKQNGVAAKLKKLVPHIFIQGCICHNIQLSVQFAFKFLPGDIDDIIKAINFHFCHSPARKDDLKTFQVEFETPQHNILKYCSTRWLSREVIL